MRIGMVGLGRMGGNMTRRLLKADHEVVAHDVSGDAVAMLVGEGARGAGDLGELVDQLEAPRAVWTMLPAGQITTDALTQLSTHLSPGDAVIDGGNARYTDSVARGEQLTGHGIDFCDAGVSGGVWGLENGYGLMVGGADEVVARLLPLFESLAPPGGFVHVGPVGSGHFTKMVHNGIEYGAMQAYGEGFALLASAEEFGIDRAKLAEVAEAWRHGTVIRSWLLDLAALALAEESFASVQGYVDDSGEGRWTVEEAVQRGVPAPAITAALFERFASRDPNLFSNRLLAALRGQFGGHALKVHLADEVDIPRA
ncbi:MAG TPA: decarboxylating 6-phosphogluconate dehydrogenase [Acidimicrobiales bacterium]|nr:decarboxylating 6-phosphogluconate dehydrogenase [Acidimicrobiales bacterium]